MQPYEFTTQAGSQKLILEVSLWFLMSQKLLSSLDSILQRSNKFGSVFGFKLMPQILDPNEFKIIDIQVPLKPECPVKKRTFLFFQKSEFGSDNLVFTIFSFKFFPHSKEIHKNFLSLRVSIACQNPS